MATTRPAVLVVGSGPSGLTVALTLRKNGISVRVIERNETFHGAVRGTAVQPRMQEILESLGVLDEVLAISTPPYTIGLHGPGKEIVKEIVWADEADQSPRIPYTGVITVGQSLLEKVLRRNLELQGVVVETGVELVGIEQDDQKATVRLKTRDGETTEAYEYIVAADGTKGTVRKILGISMIGETKSGDTMFVANVECTDLDRTHWHRWGEFGKKIFFLKPIVPAPTFQVQAMGVELPKPPPDDTKGIQEMFNDISKSTDIELRSASWISEWKANIRMADKFNVGRVFLVGDSAHCHSPAGGQGTNTGVTDALNLAWKLALVLKRLSPPALLDTYTLERMPVVAELLNVTDKIHNVAWAHMPPSTLTSGPRDDRADDPMWRPRHLLQLGVNYRWSGIVLEGREPEGGDERAEKSPYGVSGARLRAGDRAPDAPGLVALGHADSETRLFKVWEGCNLHTILAFTGHSTELRADIATLAKYRDAGVALIVALAPSNSEAPQDLGNGIQSFRDGEGHAYAGYDVGEDEVTFVVVRPDGMIGAYAKEVAQIHQFFSLFLLDKAL